MIISPYHSTSRTGAAATAAGTSERGTASAATGGTETGSAAVTLSEASRAAGAQIPAETGDVDVARVQRVVEAIRNGQYTVDTSKIADGLLAGVRDLLK